MPGPIEYGLGPIQIAFPTHAVPVRLLCLKHFVSGMRFVTMNNKGLHICL